MGTWLGSKTTVDPISLTTPAQQALAGKTADQYTNLYGVTDRQINYAAVPNTSAMTIFNVIWP